MALGDVIARLSVSLDLNSAAFEKGAQRTAKQTDALGDRMESLGKRVGNAVRGFAAVGAAIAGSALVGQIKDLVTSSLDYASSLGEVSQQLGVTTKSLQEYRYAATQVGLSQEEMDASLAKLTRTMGEAAGGAKGPLAAFDKLGINIKAFVASGKDAGELIPLIAEGLKKIETPAERAATLVDLFGRSGQKLAPLLANGAKGVNELRESAQKLGIVLTDEMIQKADDAADRIAALETVMRARLAVAVANNADKILALADRLEQLAVKAQRAFEWLSKLANSPLGKVIGFLNDKAGFLSTTNLAGKGVEALMTDPATGAKKRAGPVGAPPGGYITKPGPGNRTFGGSIDTKAVSPYLIGKAAISAYIPLPPAVIEALDRMPGTVENIAAQWEKMSKGNYIEDIAADMELLNEQTANLKANSKDAAAVMQTSFQDAATGIIGALDRMSYAFQGGGFLEKLSAVLNFGLQLGSIGVFGSKVAANIRSAPRYANGTNFASGGLSLVGERGPELVDLPRGARVTPNHKIGGGGDNYYFNGNLMTPEFWARIQAGDMAAAQGGAALSHAKLARSRKWALA